METQAKNSVRKMFGSAMKLMKTRFRKYFPGHRMDETTKVATKDGHGEEVARYKVDTTQGVNANEQKNAINGMVTPDKCNAMQHEASSRILPDHLSDDAQSETSNYDRDPLGSTGSLIPIKTSAANYGTPSPYTMASDQ